MHTACNEITTPLVTQQANRNCIYVQQSSLEMLFRMPENFEIFEIFWGSMPPNPLSREALQAFQTVTCLLAETTQLHQNLMNLLLVIDYLFYLVAKAQNHSPKGSLLGFLFLLLLKFDGFVVLQWVHHVWITFSVSFPFILLLSLS